MNSHEREIAAALHLANLLTITSKLQLLHLGLVVCGLTGPWKGLRPCLITQPVADEVGISLSRISIAHSRYGKELWLGRGAYSIDEHRDPLHNGRHQAVEWFHPVALQQETSIHVKIAAIVAVNFSTQGLEDFGPVEPLGDPTKLHVAQRSTILALFADIVRVLARALIRTHQATVAYSGSKQAEPPALSIIATLNKRLASGKSVVHGLTLALAQNGRPAPITACHRSVVCVLR